MEVLKLLQRFYVQRFGVGKLYLCEILDPIIHKCLLSCDPILWVECQHLHDEILSSLANVGPLRVREGKLALFYSLEY